MSKNLLLIFTRNPALGKVKTRLAKTVGNETALEIYKFLIQKTKEITQNLTCDKAVYYSEKVRENDLWDREIYKKNQQFGEDLGIRMKNAFETSFKNGYQNVVIIGSDLYDLSSQDIEHAFKELEENDVVIGPAEDGGYYLLGMKEPHNNVFQNKSWGTSSVKEETLNDLKNKKVHLLKEFNDVDLFEDIEHHPAFQHFLKEL
jgi:hypothetical protein